jgi:hypothetical protein
MFVFKYSSSIFIILNTNAVDYCKLHYQSLPLRILFSNISFLLVDIYFFQHFLSVFFSIFAGSVFAEKIEFTLVAGVWGDVPGDIRPLGVQNHLASDRVK